MKHITKRFIGGLLGLLLMAGCSNTLLQAPQPADEPPAAVSPAEAGTGRLTITLTGTGTDQGARTLYPNAPGSFSQYEIIFTPESGQTGISPVILTDGESSYTMTLALGNWTIAAVGSVSIQDIPGITNGDYPAARGETAVTVTPYSSISASIDLRGGVDVGKGVFNYDIAIPGDLDSATLEILSLAGPPVESANLQTAASGVFALDSGYYLLKITQVKGGVSTIRAEVIHIYAGLTTEAAGPGYDFTKVIISTNSIAELSDVLSIQPLNTASTPYMVILNGLNLGTDLKKDSDPLMLLYEALNGKYVSLDLSACTGDIQNTSPGTANSRPDRDRIVSITLPDSLTAIGECAFYGCSALASIDLPDTLASIGQDAFSACTALAAIDLPDTLASIEQGAFAGCTALTAIDLSHTLLTYIGWYTFSGCSSLMSIDLPDTLASIGNYAFNDCSSLVSIDLSYTLIASLGYYAFSSCTSLTAIDLPDTLTIIGLYAFYDCSSLVSIDLPDSLAFIGEYAFSGCISLASIDLSHTLLTSIENEVFRNCKSLTAIDLPDTLTYIGWSSFRYCSSLVSIDLSHTLLTSIGTWAFHGCSSLLAVGIPATLIGIGQDAFRGCSFLPSIDLPDTLTSIDLEAFQSCPSLTVVISRNPTPPTLYVQYSSDPPPFSNTASLLIYVPDTSVNAYKNATRWSNYASKIRPLSELPPNSDPSAGFQISFTSSAGIDLTLSGSIKQLSKSDSGSSSVTINVGDPGTYDSFRWLVDGGVLAGETGGSVTLEASNHDAGPHWLMVIAEKAGVPYSRTFTFAVAD